MLLVREVSGPADAVAGTQATYTATSFNSPNPPAEEIQKINWIVKSDDETVAQFNAVGAVLNFDVPLALIGRTIRVMPFRNSPSPVVSVISRVVGDVVITNSSVIVIDRAQWGARTDLPRHGDSVSRAARREVFIHHTDVIDDDPTQNEWEDLNEVKRRMRDLQTMRPDLGLDVPYNFVAFSMANGDLILGEGRGLDRSGAHTIGHNHSAIAISFEGDFEAQALPTHMDSQLIALGQWLRARREQDGFVKLGTARPLGREVFGHREVSSTDCPGKHLFAKLNLVRFL